MDRLPLSDVHDYTGTWILGLAGFTRGDVEEIETGLVDKRFEDEAAGARKLPPAADQILVVVGTVASEEAVFRGHVALEGCVCLCLRAALIGFASMGGGTPPPLF